jgi:hypothetical protein
MAHFAEINEENIVQRVIVVSNDDCKDQFGNESEVVGALFCHNLLGGRWVQTSYNGNIRKQYAGTGYKYDQEADVFISPQPYLSWELDENHDWQPPVARPEGEGFYIWDEDTQIWIEI